MRRPLFALALFALACGSSDDGASPSRVPKAQAPDSTVFEVQWKPDTVQLAESDASGLATPNPENGVLRFDPASAAVKALKVGDYFVLPGAGLFHVTTLVPNGTQLDVGVEDASLVDAAES